MSLATRCPACGTIFRVVQDQLKVSEGWVRCGQCHEVFHGIEALFDLDSDPAIGARRAGARQAAAAPPTRQFAQQRAEAPIPPVAPTPAAPSAAPSAAGQAGPPPMRPGYTGFTPATRPMPPAPERPAPPPSPSAPPPSPTTSPVPQVATRTTIAPRFAARLAQEAARAQAAISAASAPPAIVVTPPVATSAPVPLSTPSAPIPPSARVPQGPASAPMPLAASTAPAPLFRPSAPAPLSTPPAPAPVVAPPAPEPLDMPALPDNFAPTAPMSLDALTELAPLVPLNPPPARASAPVPLGTPSAPAPFDFARRAEQAASRWQSQPMPLQSPAPVPAPAAAPASWFAPPAAAVDAELPLDAPVAAPSPAPETAGPAAGVALAPPAEGPSYDFGNVEVVEPAPEVGGSTMPSRLADDAMEERRAGPPTLASMLPEDAGEWPPRRARKRKEPAGDAPESALVDRTKDPRFLREARAGARWRNPWVRASLTLVLLLLVVGAIAQVAWPLRDTIAARWPVTQPAWAWVCEQAGCRIEAPRAIASLALDGSSLTRTDTEHVLLFSADLHNRADHEVRMPSFDVSFMDLNGEIVARKVLSPAQLGIRQDALPALGELHVHARLQVGSLPASGFQADLFYP